MIIDKLRGKLKKPNPHLADSIKEIGLTDRTYHCLRKARIATVGDLIELSWNDLRSMRGVVRKTCVEVESILKDLGLELRKDE